MNLKRLFSTALFLSSISGLATAQNSTLTTVHDFSGGDGDQVSYGLVQAGDGNFYGASIGGGILSDGSNGYGTIYKLAPHGIFSVLHTFTGLEDGAFPYGSLVVGPDGNLYGVTSVGGGTSGPISCLELNSNCGTVFKITPSGTLTTLHSFRNNSNDGAVPSWGLVLGSDGEIYGTTTEGGTQGGGTFFRITSSGSITTLFNFGSHDLAPTNALIQGTDGAFYGTGASGGPSGLGFVMRITTDRNYILVHAFTGADGAIPYSAPIEGSDGYLYGTTAGLMKQCVYNPPPAGSCGTAFKISPSGAFSVLHNFSGGDDGASQFGPLFQAGDGNFYGANTAGGDLTSCTDSPYRQGCGVVYQLTPSGALTTLHQFHGEALGYGGLIQSGSGKLYGTTYLSNTIYTLTTPTPIPAPVQLSLNQSQITIGSPATISWQVLNAFSLTMQQCYAFQTVDSITTPLGQQSGTFSSTTKLFTGSATFTPPAPGTYSYALTCGGQESGFATLTVLRAPTTTSLTASPTSVMRPGNSLLTATVARSGSQIVLDGSVTFYADDRYLIGTVKLNSSGVATIDPSSAGVAPATYSITAKYSGDKFDDASTSPVVTVTVQ